MVDWKTIIKDRLISTGASYTSKSQEYQNDEKVVNGYLELLKSTKENCSQISGKSIKKNRQLMVLTDSDQRIQAIATLLVRNERVDVDTLISAPWNVPMTGAIKEEHVPLAVKGSGTTMMRQIYELAKINNKSTIELRPTETARSFYIDHLKMVPDDFTVAVRMPVIQDEIPLTLQVVSGNLL